MIPMPVRKGPSGEVYGNENGRALANWIVSGQRGAPRERAAPFRFQSNRPVVPILRAGPGNG